MFTGLLKGKSTEERFEKADLWVEESLSTKLRLSKVTSKTMEISTREVGLAQIGQIITLEMEYEGQVRDGQPHGHGKKTWLETGEVYEGFFEYGVPNGEGKLKMKDGSEYIGPFLKGSFSGQGQLSYSDGAVVKGEFKNGEVFGKGVYKYPSTDPMQKEEYVGHFQRSIPSGKGILKFRNGSVYTGDFSNGRMQGQGKMAIASEKTEISNNEAYVGQFDSDQYDGKVGSSRLWRVPIPWKSYIQGVLEKRKKTWKR